MHGFEFFTSLSGYLIANVTGLIFIYTAWKTPQLARCLFSGLLGCACFVNIKIVINNPLEYLHFAIAATPAYRHFIYGWFRMNISSTVTAIAVVQALLAVAILFDGWWVKGACVGTLIFMLALAPLAIASAFPFTLTLSIAAIIILKKDNFKNVTDGLELLSARWRKTGSSELNEFTD
jgi:hypothetical protein